MKFVALALALLLAVGSQAASLQADAPSQLEHIRAAMDVYLNQVKDSAKSALDQLDDTEYKELKDRIKQRMDDLCTQLKALQGVVSPVTDNVVRTVYDATADLRTSLTNDWDSLKSQTESQREKLEEVLKKHIEEYRAQLEPIINEYYTRHTAETDALRTKLEPVVGELRSKVATNWEETRNVLMPMVETVRSKLNERLENLKELAAPYVEEYKEQVKQAYSQAESTSTDDLTALRVKIEPLAEDIKTKFQTIFETIIASFNKQ